MDKIKRLVPNPSLIEGNEDSGPGVRNHYVGHAAIEMGDVSLEVVALASGHPLRTNSDIVSRLAMNTAIQTSSSLVGAMMRRWRFVAIICGQLA